MKSHNHQNSLPEHAKPYRLPAFALRKGNCTQQTASPKLTVLPGHPAYSRILFLTHWKHQALPRKSTWPISEAGEVWWACSQGCMICWSICCCLSRARGWCCHSCSWIHLLPQPKSQKCFPVGGKRAALGLKTPGVVHTIQPLFNVSSNRITTTSSEGCIQAPSSNWHQGSPPNKVCWESKSCTVLSDRGHTAVSRSGITVFVHSPFSVMSQKRKQDWVLIRSVRGCLRIKVSNL